MTSNTKFNQASEMLNNLANIYSELSESEKFQLGRSFNSLTGGKLSPYNSPNAVSVAVIPVEHNGELKYLGLRRNIEPALGRVAFPGGFVNENESPVQAVVRETFEETGLQLNDTENWSNFHIASTPRNEFLVFYSYNKVVPWSDVEAAFSKHSDKFETQEIMPIDSTTELGFPLHKEALLIHWENNEVEIPSFPKKKRKPF